MPALTSTLSILAIPSKRGAAMQFSHLCDQPAKIGDGRKHMVMIRKNAPSMYNRFRGFEGGEQARCECIHPLRAGAKDGRMLKTSARDEILAGLLAREMRWTVPRASLTLPMRQNLRPHCWRPLSPSIHASISAWAYASRKRVLEITSASRRPCTRIVVPASAGSGKSAHSPLAQSRLKAGLHYQSSFCVIGNVAADSVHP